MRVKLGGSEHPPNSATKIKQIWQFHKKVWQIPKHINSKFRLSVMPKSLLCMFHLEEIIWK